MSEGTVLDIQRCAMHDGAGIRSVVFLKGCPLHCAWCCNPESMSMSPQLFYRSRQCVGCGSCAAVCPSAALSSYAGVISVNFGLCYACGRCGEACPSGAIGLYGRIMSFADVMTELDKDAAYYAASGGGVTLSGGEALLQWKFAAELLEACRCRGWNTAVETTGYVSQEAMDAVIPYTDIFLFDYKMSDAKGLKIWTGADKGHVLDSLHHLSEKGASVVLRCILVPGVNDVQSHCDELVALQKEMPNISGIDIMPLHGFARAKYEDIGKEVPSVYEKTASEADVERWIKVLREGGAYNVKKG